MQKTEECVVSAGDYSREGISEKTRVRLNIARASAVNMKLGLGGDNGTSPKFPWVRRG